MNYITLFNIEKNKFREYIVCLKKENSLFHQSICSVIINICLLIVVIKACAKADVASASYTLSKDALNIYMSIVVYCGG